MCSDNVVGLKKPLAEEIHFKGKLEKKEEFDDSKWSKITEKHM